MGTIIGCVDRPARRQVVAGALNVSGWALGDDPRAHQLRLLVDDRAVAGCFDRYPRPDLAVSYPSYATADHPAGFSFFFDSQPYADGTHFLRLEAEAGPRRVVLDQIEVLVNNAAAELHQLPYYTHFRNFEATDRIPHRQDIYGSGPPCPDASQEALFHIRRYAGHKVLDVGCGAGAYVAPLLQAGHDCQGIEYSPECVEACRRRGLPVRRMDAHALEFEAKSFDTVQMVEVLEHLPDPVKALEEAFRVARKNVLISVPNIDVIPVLSKYQVVPWHLLEATHLNFFTPVILKKALGRFSDRVHVFPYGQFAHWVAEGPVFMQLFAAAEATPSRPAVGGL